MSSVSDKTVTRARSIPALLRIAEWPLRDEPKRSVLIVLMLVAVSIASGFASAHFGVGLLVFALLGFSARRLWLPTTFELSSKGIVYSSLGRRRRIPWAEFARYEIHEGGILLSPDPEPQTFSSMRGLFVPWHGRRDELLGVLDFYLQSQPPNQHPTTRSLSQILPPPSDSIQSGERGA